MTKDEIMRLAREACFRTGFISLSSGETLPFIAPVNATSCIVELERFAALVAAAEREECHKLRQTLPNPYGHCQVSAHAHDMAIADYGRAIRARSKT